jgi:hypothetical protein
MVYVGGKKGAKQKQKLASEVSAMPEETRAAC